jgi:guanylate cyclase
VDEDHTVMNLVIGFVCAGVMTAILIYYYLAYKRRQADSVWSVSPSELKFHQPPEVIGQGTFGLVVLAEYRGTQVAVKRVLPVSAKGNVSGSENFFLLNILADRSDTATTEGGNQGMDSGEDLETGVVAVGQRPGENSEDLKGLGSKSNSFDQPHGSRRKSWIPLATNTNKLQQKLRNGFIAEMRHLSKLRHPCITTVMGAVIAKKHDPMLVMEYMDHGSLHDLLHNLTLRLDGDLVLPILRDIAQGLRFLHAAHPQVVHGDLKAANVLVDSKFRAKVADFGLSQKKKLGATGTPYWMAPELIRGESSTTSESDMYSFGIILYEVYSRKEPYEGEKYHDVISMIADPLVNKRPPVPPSCPKSVATIMTSCLKRSAKFRPTAEELDKELKRLDVVSAGPMMIAKRGLGNDETEHALLYEVLPKHVADVLRSGGKVEPESKELVTIFFSDIVGFTNISSELTPIKISDLLDRLYYEFDELSHELDVFKVETIGDAWMGVTNLIKDQAEDHAKLIAQFSIAAIKAANRTLIDTEDPDKGYVNIRVGFHSGPVVANVVGSRNPRYCLFGDTVNTASRMESNSKENHIHCSARAAGLLLMQWPELVLEHRGRINIKGKGEMRTFWVNEPRVLARRQSVQVRKPAVKSAKRRLSE